jgi:hypothetical protein
MTAQPAQLTQTHPQAARDVPPGESWAFREHRTMAEVMGAALAAENAKQPTPVEHVA